MTSLHEVREVGSTLVAGLEQIQSFSPHCTSTEVYVCVCAALSPPSGTGDFATPLEEALPDGKPAGAP